MTDTRKTHTAWTESPNLPVCNAGYLTGAPHLQPGQGGLRAVDGERPTCVNCAKVYDRAEAERAQARAEHLGELAAERETTQAQMPVVNVEEERRR